MINSHHLIGSSLQVGMVSGKESGLMTCPKHTAFASVKCTMTSSPEGQLAMEIISTISELIGYSSSNGSQEGCIAWPAT